MRKNFPQKLIDNLVHKNYNYKNNKKIKKMKKMRVLLINPPQISFYQRMGLKLPPLGLAYIAAYLKRRGYETQIADLTAEKSDYKSLPVDDFDIIGISADTTRYPTALQIADYVKNYKRKWVVLGGPHVSFFDEEPILHKKADFIVRGEGELPMADLVETIEGDRNYKEVKNLTYMENGKIRRNPWRPFLRTLDDLPFPARELLPLDKYTTKLEGRPVATMVTSRGCPFNCEFCSSSEFFGIRWRSRSLTNILEEMDILYNRYGYRALAFLDDNFTLLPKRVIEISEEVLRRKWDIKWWCFSRVDTITRNEEMVKIAARAGLREVFVGFESGNQETLDDIGKRLTLEQSLKAVKILKKYGIRIWGSFILGGLKETKEMINDTVKFAKLLDPDIVQFSVLTPYPGTRLYEKVKDRLLTNDWRKYWAGVPVIKLDYLSPKELTRLVFKAYAAFYLRPKKLLKVGFPYLIRYFFRH